LHSLGVASGYTSPFHEKVMEPKLVKKLHNVPRGNTTKASATVPFSWQRHARSGNRRTPRCPQWRNKQVMHSPRLLKITNIYFERVLMPCNPTTKLADRDIKCLLM
jgi:hypothetical protein